GGRTLHGGLPADSVAVADGAGCRARRWDREAEDIDVAVGVTSGAGKYAEIGVAAHVPGTDAFYVRASAADETIGDVFITGFEVDEGLGGSFLPVLGDEFVVVILNEMAGLQGVEAEPWFVLEPPGGALAVDAAGRVIGGEVCAAVAFLNALG